MCVCVCVCGWVGVGRCVFSDYIRPDDGYCKRNVNVDFTS